jgi:hypothetical protein
MRVMRIGFLALTTLIPAGVALLPGCATTQKPAWEHYDDCSSQNPSFVAMAACGKQRRAAYCEANRSDCNPVGDAVVAYADSLAQAVSRHEITEAEARRRWLAYRNGQL